MATKITTRDGFKNYCLRKIGFPVLELNMDEQQIDDRVDEALRKFWQFHYDGSERIYYVHQVTTTDMANKFLTMPPNINGVVRILPISSAYNVGSVFSLQYQIVMSDMWRWSSVQMTQFYQIYQYSQLIEQILVGQQPIRFNELSNRLYLDMEWNRIPAGNYIIVEAFRVLNPDHLTLCLDSVTGTFREGEVITASGGATATIDAINKQSLQELFVKDWSANITATETITGGTSGATATVKIAFDCDDVWNNQWLQNYCVALIEENWGRNLTKFDRVTLPSGMVLNGERIFARAQEDIKKYEYELYNTYNIPAVDMIG